MLTLWGYIWWKFVPGQVITVRWPNGPMIRDFEDQYKTDEQLFSADPNDHYRPWLETYVGKQGWDWNWKPGMGTGYNIDTVIIKFRRNKNVFASIASLKWS